MNWPGAIRRIMFMSCCLTLLISTVLQGEGLTDSVGQALAVAIGVAIAFQIRRAINDDPGNRH